MIIDKILYDVLFQDCHIGVQQSGANYMLGEGFDVIFSLINEYHKSASTDMKQQGECSNH